VHASASWDGESFVIFRARVLLAGAAAAVLAVVGAGGLTARAKGDGDRTISFYNIHTKESLTVTYMRDGKRDPEAMKKISWMMRDWRRDEATQMDPELIDLVWQVHEELGSKEPIHLISGFRSSKTNESLRRKGGGQAKFSQHILGKAADIHFPDVPLKRLRYSGLVRERGGVGYYPTSGVPFVHLDTGRVRHWPRIPRYELALLFPDGKSKHVPSDGRPLSRQDYVVAKSRYQDLAQQVAAFFDIRNGVKQPTLVADASDKAESRKQAAPEPRQQVASLAPVGPRLVSTPQSAARPAPSAAPTAGWGTQTERATPEPHRAAPVIGEHERNQLASLFRLASFTPGPKLIAAPRLPRGVPDLSGGGLPAPAGSSSRTASLQAPRVAAVDPKTVADPGPGAAPPRSISDIIDGGWSTGWAASPAFDEEHPDEMSYRPFPVAPFLTDSHSPDDPVLIGMVAPRVRETLELLGQIDDPLPMRMRPGQQIVGLLWAQEFKGTAVDLSAVAGGAEDDPIGNLTRRTVRTSQR